MPIHISNRYNYHMPPPELGKWRIAIRRQTDYVCPWKMVYEFGIYKIIQWPREGEILTPLHYEGFRFTWHSPHPVEVQAVWNIPTRQEIKQHIIIWSSRVVRYLASLWVNTKGLR